MSHIFNNFLNNKLQSTVIDRNWDMERHSAIKDQSNNHEFILWLFKSNQSYIKNLLIVYIIFFPAFSLLDYYSTDGSFNATIIIRLGIGLPALLIAFICSYIKKLYRYIRFINATALLVMNLCICLMYCYIQPEEDAFNSYYAGLIITIATIGISMSSFKLSSLYIGISGVSFIAISYFVHDLHNSNIHLFIKSSTYILVASFLFAITSNIIERFSLKLYHAQIQISNERDKITNEKEILENLNTTKDRFFRIISHDLRSPFTSLIGYFDILLRNNQSEFKVKKEDIRQIYLHIRRTYNLLNNLLNWSKTQLNQYKFVKEEYLLEEILSENKSLYNQIANQKNISIIQDFPTDAKVYCDKEMIMVIVRNLLFNAIKFTDTNGKIVIKGTLHTNNITEIAVIDSGIGISKENIELILNPNEYITTKGTSNETGSGIGLIICHDLLQKHNSRLQIESETNVGSKFFFNLPTKNDESD
ncbi:HAMP domain-containing histidine kinase [Labilibacter sediminis]|nr:HAMP domain-containing histidine kinase [Labilibacter sediminis]